MTDNENKLDTKDHKNMHARLRAFIANEINAHLRDHDMIAGDLAYAAGVGEGSLGTWRRGKILPGLVQVYSLACAMGREPLFFLPTVDQLDKQSETPEPYFAKGRALTEHDVREIRESGNSDAHEAENRGCSSCTIRDIRIGRTWVGVE